VNGRLVMRLVGRGVERWIEFRFPRLRAENTGGSSETRGWRANALGRIRIACDALMQDTGMFRQLRPHAGHMEEARP
jgi:hypothetical protein